MLAPKGAGFEEIARSMRNLPNRLLQNAGLDRPFPYSPMAATRSNDTSSRVNVASTERYYCDAYCGRAHNLLEVLKHYLDYYIVVMVATERRVRGSFIDQADT